MRNVNIHGSKNAALPIIAGTLLAKRIYYLKNIPPIKDISVQLAILKQFNVTVNWINQEDLLIDTTHLRIPANINYDSNCRGTYYFMGSIAAYNVDLQFTIANGCDIDNRKYDYHIELLELLGKKVIIHPGNNIQVTGICDEAKEITYTFQKPSVGGTINALFMFCKSTSLITLNNYAKDPYVLDTIRFLQELGFHITYTEESIMLRGYNESLDILEHTVIEDTIEAITYIIYSAINLQPNSRSTYTIGPFNTDYMGTAYALLQTTGIELIESERKQHYYIYRQTILKPFHITTGYYPEIYTDIQPLLSLLALYTSTHEPSSITETIWNDRFKYIYELNKIGTKITLQNNTINIPSLRADDIISSYTALQFTCPDLRGGMALYLLMKKYNILNTPLNKTYIDRGYADYENNIDLILNSDLVLNSDLIQKSKYNTTHLSNIKIGGNCKDYVQVYDDQSIITCINDCIHKKLKYKLIGSGSNIYFADYYDGVLIHNKIKYMDQINNTNHFTVSAGTLLLDFIFFVAKYGYDLSNMAGIPGTVGGAIYGNAGAYGLAMSDIVQECSVWRNNEVIHLNKAELDFTYRNSLFKMTNNRDIILSCIINLSENNIENNIDTNIEKIHNNIGTILAKRNQRIPSENTLGSVFKNIDKGEKTIYMWQLIDGLELRGKTVNNITIHETHPNIFINSGDATCTDMNTMLDYIEQLIYTKYKIICEREIECIC